jgi:S-DNA-T family DNA segregation ATPase FtsK/SpoIIIE
MAARKSTKSSRKSTSRSGSKKTSRSKAKPRGTPSQSPPSSQPLWSNITTDRKMDIAGVILAMLGFLTLLSLLSSTNGSIIGAWVSTVKQVFGWGLFILPIILIALGLWLILRNFERVPRFSLERAAGFLLIFLNLLVILHIFTIGDARIPSLIPAANGEGGGYLGGAALTLLYNGLGWGGALIALLAWLVIAFALSSDLSILEMFGWMTPLYERLESAWDEWQASQAAKSRGTAKPNTRDLSPQPDSASLNTSANPLSGPSFAGAGAAGEQIEWSLPPIDEILEEGGEVTYDDDIDRHRARVIEESLASFGAPAKVVEINRGPTITQFGVEPDYIETRGSRKRVRVGKIAALADDLALALAARRIRIQAPVPSKGYVGIEVPNEEVALVSLRDVLESNAFRRLKSNLSFALGQDVAGSTVAADLAAMPHLLIAGATGSGKSVCVNSLICCLLLNNTPDDLRLIMVDPKRVELTGYNGIPHLLAPVVVELERVIGALQWVAREMDQRYHKLAQAGVRNITDYNARLVEQGGKKLPLLVVIIDELADLMMLAPDETERTITRLAQLARATGIHLVISTQRPSVDVVTGLIKANFPARIAFAVASGVDSRVILDQPGAERLLGSGDMLFQAPDAAAPVRLQGTWVSEPEIMRLVYYWRALSGITEAAPVVSGGVVDAVPQGIPLKQMEMWEEMAPEEDKDPLYDEAVDLVRREGRASISMLQRRLRIGYTRAARLIESMQAKEIVGPSQPGTQGLEVLDYGPAAPPADER